MRLAQMLCRSLKIECVRGMLVSTVLACISAGCTNDSSTSQQPELTPVQTEPVDEGPIEPAVVELSNPKYRIDGEGNFMFEVNYKFTKGRARQYYLLTVNFPGSQNMCLKHMEAHHLKEKEGVIRDGIPLFDPTLTSYEIVLSEADSPMNQYLPISNTVGGKVEIDGGKVKKDG